MENTKTTISHVTDSTLSYDGRIYGQNFTVRTTSGVESKGCVLDPSASDEAVNLGISYKDDTPVSARILPSYPEDPPLDNEVGLVAMFDALLNHIHDKIPEIREVEFEDNTSIECGENARIPLHYFSIAFNGKTWYEYWFNARQKNLESYNKYKRAVNVLLNSLNTKTEMSFFRFLEISNPPMEIIEELEMYYERSITFGRFFKSIPVEDRCRLVGGWIGEFMKLGLADAFDTREWVIGLFDMPIMRGHEYYCPKGRIFRNTTYRDYGVNAMDV